MIIGKIVSFGHRVTCRTSYTFLLCFTELILTGKEVDFLFCMSFNVYCKYVAVIVFNLL